MGKRPALLALAGLALLAHPSCGLGSTPACLLCVPAEFEIAVQDCTTLPSLDWDIGPLNTEGTLYPGQGRRVFLWPLYDASCQATIASIEWVPDDAGVLVVPELGLPVEAREAWIPGAARGETFLSARLQFTDGQEATSAPFAVRVEDLLPSGEYRQDDGVVIDFSKHAGDSGVVHPFDRHATAAIRVLEDQSHPGTASFFGRLLWRARQFRVAPDHPVHFAPDVADPCG